MKVTRLALAQVTELVFSGAKKATKYLGPDLVVKATRRHKADRRARTVELVLTAGKPNYAERKFVKACKVAGEKFPVRKIQVRWDK